MTGLAAIHADPLGLLVAFGAGMLSFLSPCVLPLVPAYLSMVSGLSAAELTGAGDARRPAPVPVGVGAAGGLDHEPVPDGVKPDAPVRDAGTPGLRPADARAKLVRGLLAFIGGFTLVFTILGASASAVGRLFLTHQQALQTASGILIVGFGAILVATAAGVSLPQGLAGERRFAIRPSVLGRWAPPVMGMAFAFAWTPCIGPVLGSVLALAAGSGGSTAGGIVLLVTYSLGLGIPFLLSGLAFGRMTDLLARVRHRLVVVDLVGGAILIAFGLLLATGNVDIISSHISGWLRDLHLSRLSTS